MEFPEFFNKVENIVLRDDLSSFLGSTDGVIDISYLDIVKFAGHSCATVAEAYLLAMKGSSYLFGENLPERGKIKVEFKAKKEEGVIGVKAAVISNILGSADEGGFKGISGNFSRNNLLFFNAKINGFVRFTRIDTGKSVDLTFNPDIVKPSPIMWKLFERILNKEELTKEELETFSTLWQDRVEKILIDNINNKDLIKIEEIN